jgi:hypothetical protein
MQITATAIMKVDINASEVIDKLIGGYYVSSDNKLMLSQYDGTFNSDIEVHLPEEEENYYRNLLKVKRYLTLKKIK